MTCLNVILADDIEGWLLFNLQNLKNFFEGKEVCYYLFKSASEAYNFALESDKPVHLVLTDLEMEPMEKLAGEWLIENLKNLKSTQNAKFVIISSSPAISAVALRTNAEAFLAKPAYHSNPLTLKYKLQEIME